VKHQKVSSEIICPKYRLHRCVCTCSNFKW